MKHLTRAAALAVAAACFSACGTSRKAVKETSVAALPETAASAEAYKERVVANFQTAGCITARASVTLTAGAKDISAGGSLKMKRDDVIQLSLTFLGLEVGRIEFTPADVLIVDKIHKQYVRAPYSQASFLESAELDFYSLQSLFWNEIFSPGTRDVGAALRDFSVASSGDHTLLSLTSAPKLDYSFLTITGEAALDRTTITPKNAAGRKALTCKYGDFVKFGGKKFPSRISVSFSGGGKELGLDIRLSGLSDDSSWPARTEVPQSYRQRSADEILRRLSTL